MSIGPTGLIGFGAGRTITVVQTDTGADTTNSQAVTTFSGKSLGVAAADRVVVVGVSGWATNFAVSSLTIGGVSAAAVVSLANGFDIVEMWSAVVPTGTTGDVVVTFAGGQDACGIDVLAMYNANGAAAYATASDTDSDPASVAIAAPGGGAVIGYCGLRSNTDRTFIWTGLTEAADGVVETGTSTQTAAYGYGGGTITCTPSGAGVRNPLMALASWSAA